MQSALRGRFIVWRADDPAFGHEASASSRPTLGMRPSGHAPQSSGELDHWCQPFGARHWVTSLLFGAARDCAGNRSPSGDTDRHGGPTPRGFSTGAKREPFGVQRGAGRGASFGTRQSHETDPGRLLREATGRIGSAAAFGLPADRTGGRPTFGSVPSSAFSEPDEAETLPSPSLSGDVEHLTGVGAAR